MQLEHSFSVPVGVDEAWRILSDVDRIAPCLPGTVIDSVAGDEVTGAVKVKLGPLNLNYRGKAVFLEKDEAGRRAVLDANGSDVRGHGSAAARVTATLQPDGDAATTVQVLTELDLTGKPAQFGHGVMADVGTKLLGQFADALARTLPRAAESPGGSAAEPGPLPEAATEAVAAAEPVVADDPEPSAEADYENADPASAEPDLASEELVEIEEEDDEFPEEDELVAADSMLVGLADEERPPAPDARGADDGDTGGLDLLHFARPAMAKRLAPVAVAVVVVLLAVRRRAAGRR